MNLTDTSLVLLVNREEWAARSFESILRPHGYVILKAYTGRQGLELAAKIRPDVVMIEHRLPDMMSDKLCQGLRALPTIRPSTPILAFSTRAMERRERLKQLRMGAWAVLSPPFDPEEVLARVERYVAAKRDTDAALEESHLDPLTGCYNLQGLMRRVTELAADAARSGRELGCVVLGPSQAPGAAPGPTASGLAEGDPAEIIGTAPAARPGGEPAEDPALTRALAKLFLETARMSDAVGRTGGNDFVIIAPGTDQKGAQRLAERLLEALEKSQERDEALRTVRLKAGVRAAAARGGRLGPEELLVQATTALRRAQREANGIGIHVFDEAE